MSAAGQGTSPAGQARPVKIAVRRGARRQLVAQIAEMKLTEPGPLMVPSQARLRRPPCRSGIPSSAGEQESFGDETGQVPAGLRNEHLRYRDDPPARIGLGCPARESGPRASASRQEGGKPRPAERPNRRRSAEVRYAGVGGDPGPGQHGHDRGPARPRGHRTGHATGHGRLGRPARCHRTVLCHRPILAGRRQRRQMAGPSGGRAAGAGSWLTMAGPPGGAAPGLAAGI